VTTDEFVALAEKISRQELDDLFETWLFTAAKPEVEAEVAVAARSAAPATARMEGMLRRLDDRR
jgi:hypothetical protein